MNLQENIDRIREVMGLDDNIYYHGTGNVTKVMDALKTKTFIPHKSGGVENGMFITPNMELASQYAEQTGGDDIGVIRLKFNQKPHIKKFWENFWNIYILCTRNLYLQNPREKKFLINTNNMVIRNLLMN
jgi:hypothetical protein